MSGETKWAVSVDGETWVGGLSRQGAIDNGSEMAREFERTSFQIGVSVPMGAKLFGPCASSVLDEATGRVQDEVWPDFEGFSGIDSSKREERALQVMLDHAFSAWVELYEIGDVGFQVEAEETWSSSDDGESFHPEPGEAGR